MRDFVFCKRDATPLNPDILRKNVHYPGLDRLDIARSASGSGAIGPTLGWEFHRRRGVSETFTETVGRSTINMTADVYPHISAEAEREGALAVERAI